MSDIRVDAFYWGSEDILEIKLSIKTMIINTLVASPFWLELSPCRSACTPCWVGTNSREHGADEKVRKNPSNKKKVKAALCATGSLTNGKVRQSISTLITHFCIARI